MENKDNNKTINEALQIAKKYSNKKTILSMVSMLLVVGLGIVSAIPEFVLSADKISTSKFWTNTIINIIKLKTHVNFIKKEIRLLISFVLP